MPAILSNICFFLFTITDAVFIGRGIGTNALGAMNLINRFILVMGAVNMLISIGGVAIYAVRIGRGDVEDADKIFRHGMLLAACVSAVFSFVGVFFTDEVCTMLGAGDTFHSYAADYLFCYSICIVPSDLYSALQQYCRNDGAPGLVSAVVIITTVCNIFGDWFLIFPMSWGVKGRLLLQIFHRLLVCLPC